MTSGPVQPATHLGGNRGGGRRGEHLHAAATSGPVQLASHSILVKGGHREVIGRSSKAIKSQSRVNQRSSATHSISARVGGESSACRCDSCSRSSTCG